MSTGCTRGSIENSDNFLVLLLDNILFFETFPRIDVDCSSGLWLVQADHVMVILCSDWWMSWHVNWKTTGFSKAETKVLHQVHRISDELKLFLVRSFWWLVKRSWDFHFFGSTERQYWDSREWRIIRMTASGWINKIDDETLDGDCKLTFLILHHLLNLSGKDNLGENERLQTCFSSGFLKDLRVVVLKMEERQLG